MSVVREYAACPECGSPAEIADRFVLESTAGPVEHAIVRCAAEAAHRYTLPLGRLARTRTRYRKGAGSWTPSS